MGKEIYRPSYLKSLGDLRFAIWGYFRRMAWFPAYCGLNWSFSSEFPLIPLLAGGLPRDFRLEFKQPKTAYFSSYYPFHLL